MVKLQAKKIINTLSKEWRVKKAKTLLEIVNFLDDNIDRKLSFFNGFEFSFIEGENNIRLLHLNFWKPELLKKESEKILKKREKNIKKIFRQLIKVFNCKYNLNILKSFFEFNQQNGFWPIQFGLEYQKKIQPKIKVYLSLEERSPKIKREFSLKKFCQQFNLDYKFLSKLFANKKLETVAIDFLANKGFQFKFYPILKENQGLLYRVNQDSKILSRKTWNRFPNGLTLNEVEKNFMKLPSLISKIIIENNLKIHYLCQENEKKSIYFR